MRLIFLLAAAASALALPARADELVGTLKKIHDSGAVTLARAAGGLVAFGGSGGRHVGLSLGVWAWCRRVQHRREHLTGPAVGSTT